MNIMDPGSWSPYNNQQPFLHGSSESPRSMIIPPPTPTDDSINSYSSTNMMLSSPCQALPNLPSVPEAPEPTVPQTPQLPSLINTNYDPTILSPPIRTPKENYFRDNLYNGICKESQPAIPDFIQTPSLPSRNDNMANCIPREQTNTINNNNNNNNNSHNNNAPNDGFHPPFQPKNRPSPGPFGVLPHEAVMPRPSRFDRGKDKFVTPIAKPVVSYNNGQYAETDVNGIYTSAPLTTHSVFSNENASRSPIMNSVTSPSMSNFSSPSDYYSSPKNNFGTCNNVQSPMPPSPSVSTAPSYPSSPFTSVDGISHIAAPPCSPISSSTYLKLQERAIMVGQVPPRNGYKLQHSPGSNMCYPQPPLPPPPLPPPPVGFHHNRHVKTSDFNAYSHNHLSSTSYPPLYPTAMPCEDPSLKPRLRVPHSNMPPPHNSSNQMSYPQPPTPMPASSMENSGYMPNTSSGDHTMMYNACSSDLQTGQSMPGTGFVDPTVITPVDNHCSIQQEQTPSQQLQQVPGDSVMPSLMSNDRQFEFAVPDITEDKNALDMFNSHIDSGVHNPENCQSSISFLETELSTLDPGMLSNNSREMHPPEPGYHPPMHNTMPMDVMNPEMHQHAQVPPNYHNNMDMGLKNNMVYGYNSNMGMCRPGNMTFNTFPRKRGRRGRRRRAANIQNRADNYRYPPFKTEPSMYYSNGYPMDSMKFHDFQPPENCSYASNEFRPNPDYRLNDFRPNDYRPNSDYRLNSDFRHPDIYNNQCPKSYKDRLDAYEFHTQCYPPSKYQSVRKKDSTRLPSCVVSEKQRQFFSIEEELSFLGDLTFPIDDVYDSHHTFMKTRNKDSEGFLQCYKNFLEVRKTMPDDEDEDVEESRKSPTKEPKHSKEHKEKKGQKPKPIILKIGRSSAPGEWRLTEPVVFPVDSTSEEDSNDSTTNASSHNKKPSNDHSDSEYDRKRNFNESSSKHSKHSAKRIFKSSSGHSKSSSRSSLSHTNSNTLPAGNDPTTAPAPKKRGRKAKNFISATTQKAQAFSSKIDEEAAKFLGHPVKKEVLSDDEEVKAVAIAARRSSLRSQRDEISIKLEPMPGPSIKIEPVDVSSDEIDILDDSDSDPAWTPSNRIPKICDATKSSTTHQTTKRRRKRSYGSQRMRRKRGSNDEGTGKKPGRQPGRQPKNQVPDIKIKQEKGPDMFFISKKDLGKDKVAIWRIDREMKMLQRFDPYDEHGLLVHRNTYAYAAWNSATKGQYIQVKVKVLSLSSMLYVVQYLGLEQSTNNNALKNPDPCEATPAHPLRENFEVFLQTLISQALDPNFLSEIMSENDEYFLNNIKEIEKTTAERKKKVFNDTWDKELKKCAELYPCVNILPCISCDSIKCQVCKSNPGEKLIQFYGPPYDSTTLGSTDAPLSNKTQFNVCTACSSIISLYSKLHHQKYNFFIKCRTKMNSVRGDKNLESHILLEHCLQDSMWVNMLFHEMEGVWCECDRVS